MLLKKYFLFCFTCLLPLLSFGQQADTLGSKLFQEVQILTKRPTLFTIGSRQTNIDSSALSQQAAGNVADLLQTRTPIFVKTYGQNMLATVSFRGTSASHTAILWNGLSITQPTLGLTDLSLLPVSSLKCVQLLHGSGSSNFGSGAIGGAILLNSDFSLKPGFMFKAQQDLGSFGRRFTQAEGSFGTGKTGLEVSVFKLKADNDFQFINTAKFGAPKERQENAAQDQLGFTANLNLQLNEKNLFYFRNWFTSSNTQLQSTMGSTNSNARNLNKNLRSMAEWNHFSSLGTTNVRIGFFNDFMNYRDEGQNSNSEVQTYQAQAEHGFIIKKKINLNVGTEVQHFAAQVAEYGKNTSENRAAVFALFRYDVFERLSLNLNWRRAFIQRFDPPAAPTFGFNFGLLTTAESELNWKGNVSRGYRVPTLNDRFWPPGNLDLKPEESLSYESGLVYKFNSKKLSIETEVTAYKSKVENWIQWVPGKGILWAPENLKEVKTNGIEYSAKVQNTFGKFKITSGGNYAYTIAQQTEVYDQTSGLSGKQLMYVPFHTATAYSDLNFKNWQISLNWQLTGSRFSTPENDRELPAYQLLTMYAGKNFRWKNKQIQVLARIQNLTNTVYQNLEYYAMPGRHYNLSLRFHLD